MNIKDAIFGAQSLQKLAAASDDLQGSLPIADIDRGIIYTRDGGLVGLFEVLPMNFSAKHGRACPHCRSTCRMAQDRTEQCADSRALAAGRC